MPEKLTSALILALVAASCRQQTSPDRCLDVLFAVVDNRLDENSGVASIQVSSVRTLPVTFRGEGLKVVSNFLSSHKLNSDQVAAGGDMKKIGKLTITFVDGGSCEIPICRMPGTQFVLRPSFADIFVYFSDIDGLIALVEEAASKH